MTTEHLSGVEAAAYVDGRLSPVERARAEAHMEACDACRSEVVEVARVIVPDGETVSDPQAAPGRPTVSRRGRRLLLPGLGIAAAAALAVVLFWPSLPTDSERGTPRDAERIVETEGVPTLGVVRPEAGGALGREERLFVWRGADADAVYRLTLSDEVGRTLWNESTGDTTLVLPDEVVLQAGATYFWRVDALLRTGRSATTRVRSFTVGR